MEEQMSKKTLSIILTVVGVLVLVVALLAGILGFPHQGFGYNKIAVAVVGAVIAAAGIVFLSSNKKPEAPAAPVAPVAPEAPKAPEAK
jgi:flagellar basal body-associated protein FliL